MAIRRTIRRWLPPPLVDLFNDLPSGRLMSSYSNAMSQRGEGYSADYIAEIVVVKTETACRLVNRDRFVFEMGSLRPLIGVGLVPCQQKIRVLDFGGAAGLHYFTTCHFLPAGTALE